ncbi:iron-containing alcohol dehydrogenase family protein [Streptococcus devriesei]|uniref:iron-containing alcohol dehydrogenase family protein n=1 Tax=Streptococcus devriesei TaxID=231233 RepID=UPI0003FFDD6D|nr:iron-containing alcohol dehydrogenase family protein [Streptococcus devriesei]
MLKDFKVKVGPQYYRYGENAIMDVEKLLNSAQAKKVLVVHGTISWEKAKPYLTFLNTSDFEFEFHQYTGECSYYGADLIVDKVKGDKIDFIIGVGGGKLADLVGYAGNIANVPFGLIPTLASNCAPWTPLSVMYKESGEAEGKTEHFLQQARFLLADPRLIIDSPVNYFIAGIADTLAKWYESDMITQQTFLQSEPFVMLARYTALIAKDILMRDGSKAIEDMKNVNVTDEFVHCSEIIFATAGLVGGLGDKYARNAAAHALHDGIAKYIPKSHSYLHGEKVAYGIFYQLALEDKWNVIDDLLPYYNKMNLPTSLTNMGIFPKNESVINDIVDFMDSKEKVHLIPVDTSKKNLKEKLLKLEDYIANKK